MSVSSNSSHSACSTLAGKVIVAAGRVRTDGYAQLHCVVKSGGLQVRMQSCGTQLQVFWGLSNQTILAACRASWLRSEMKTTALPAVLVVARLPCRWGFAFPLTFIWGTEAAVVERTLSLLSRWWASIRSYVHLFAWFAVRIAAARADEGLLVVDVRIFQCRMF